MKLTLSNSTFNDNSTGLGQLNYIRIVSNIIYPTIMVIGVLGNMMVITVIFKMKDMRSSTNSFLANLAVADIMVLVVIGTQQLIETNSEQGIMAYSDKMCNALYFLMKAVNTVSVLTVLAIGFERYFAVCKPLKARHICTRNRAFKICLMTWPLAAMISSPYLFFRFYVVRLEKGHKMWTVCQKPTDTFWLGVYYVTSSLVVYFIPLIILTVFYVVIARRLKEPVAPNVNISAVRYRRHVVTMLAAVIMSFFVCHLPLRIHSLFFFFGSKETISSKGFGFYESLWLFCGIMVYLHSILNPILYNLMSKRFRASFKSVCCGAKQRKSHRLSRKNTLQTTTSASVSSC